MNTKNLMVFFAIACALFLVAGVSAYNITDVSVGGVGATKNTSSVVAGETVMVEVWFTALSNDSDVTVDVEFEGKKVSFSQRTSPFDVEENKTYKKILNVKVPYELKDERSDALDLLVTIKGRENKTSDSWKVRVQRPTYNAEVKSVTMASSLEAGETLSVEFVIKNRGYNRLDDLYITLSVPALGVEKTLYLDDLVIVEVCDNNCDKSDTVSGRISLAIPYEAASGVYAVELSVFNDDTSSSVVKQLSVNNDFAGNVIVSNTKKSAGVGQSAQYSLLLVNPTNKMKVFRLITETGSDLSASVDEPVVVVPAGSSKSVSVSAKAEESGEYKFIVNIFSGETLTSKAILSLDVEGKGVSESVANPVVILAIVLSIVFVILLIVLIVLVTKKPEKSEDFGESYY